MTARILVVDQVDANVNLLQVRLLAEYFDVITANDGYTALAMCEKNQVDLVLLDAMLPEMDGFEVCEKIRAMPESTGVPVVIVTALDQPHDRIRGIKAGADDFFVKPVNDLLLVSRIKNLLARSMNQGVTYPNRWYKPSALVVGRFKSNSDNSFGAFTEPLFSETPTEALDQAASGNFDLVIVHYDLADYDPLRLCSQLRSMSRTRAVPIILVVGRDDEQMGIRAFDIGVTDCLFEPLHSEELAARVSNIVLRGSAGWKAAGTNRDSTGLSGVYRISPINFKVVDDVLVVQPSRSSIELEDERSVAAARAVLVADGDRLIETLHNSNLDRRLIDVFVRQITIATSGMDVIQLGLINLESGAMLDAAEREGEILPTLSASLQSFCLKTEMFVGQFKEWKRFAENARSLPSLTAELPKLTDVVDDLSRALRQNVSTVDPDVPRSIDFVLDLVKNPKGGGVAAGFALVSLIENVVVAVADYCAGLLKGTAEVASKKLQTALGVGVAVAVCSALSAYLEIAGRLGISPWVGPAMTVLKRFISTVSPI